MKKGFSFLAFVLIFSHFALAQINTFDLLDKVKNHKPLPNRKDNIDYQKVHSLHKTFSKLAPMIQSTRNIGANSLQPKTLQIYQSPSSSKTLYEISNDIRIAFDAKFNTPSFIEAKSNLPLVKSKYYNFTLSNSFFDFISNYSQVFQLANPKEEFIEKEIVKTSEGECAIRYQQVFKGIPIWGKEVIAHYNKFGELEVINSKVVPTFDNSVNLWAKIPKETALQIAINNLKERTNFADFPKELKKFVSDIEPRVALWFYYENPLDKPILVWVVEIRPNLLERYRYFINAINGKIVEFYQMNPSDGPALGNGVDLLNQNRQLNIFLSNGVYYLVDASKPMFNQNIQSPNGVIVTYTNGNSDLTKNSNPIIVSSQNTTFTDPAAVSAHYFLGKVYDYYYSTFSRNSLDGNKKNIVSIVHVTNNGQSMANAFWTGDFIVFGDGGTMFYPLARGLDVIAHEFTHGVVQFTVDLEYKYQSGALNEGFADWGGAMVDRDDWLIGEDVVNPAYFPSGTMRDMRDPHNQAYPGDPNWLPAHMNEYQDLPLDKDNGGVHINVGIINKATYLIGATIGKDKLEKIYYRVLEKRYLTKQANFVDFRLACERAAKELFGENSNEHQAVKNAFDAVGIGNSGGSAPSPSLPPVVGKHYIIAVDANQNYLWRLEEKLTSQSDIVKISNSPVFTASGSSVSATENGAYVFYIDYNNMIHAINMWTNTDTILADASAFRSIAVSGGANPKIAITLVDFQPTIYFYDIGKDSSWIFQLYTPTTSHNQIYTKPLFAVNLTWTPDGNYLVYDAINVRYEPSGDTTYFAEINLIDPSSGVILRIVPPLPTGVHIASPMFSQTNNNRLAFVVWNEITGIGTINIGDLYTGSVSTLVQTNLNQLQVATPVFSPNDTAIVFQSYDPHLFVYNLYKIKLAQDKFTPSGQAYLYATNAGIPRWIALGVRMDVADNQNITEQSIYPNPSNGTVFVRIESISENLNIRVIDVVGNIVDAKFETIDNSTLKITLPNDAPAGVYFVEIQSQKKAYFQRFILLR